MKGGGGGGKNSSAGNCQGPACTFILLRGQYEKELGEKEMNTTAKRAFFGAGKNLQSYSYSIGPTE